MRPLQESRAVALIAAEGTESEGSERTIDVTASNVNASNAATNVGTTPLPQGFSAHVANMGVKDETDDFVVIASDGPAVGAGVFTQSRLLLV